MQPRRRRRIVTTSNLDREDLQSRLAGITGPRLIRERTPFIALLPAASVRYLVSGHVWVFRPEQEGKPMSRNANLVQEISEEGQSSNSGSVQEPGHRTSTGQTNSRWAEEEALRLVQHIFLLQTQEPPKIVIFAGIDHGNGCSQICASVAETLAANAGRPVCLVEANFHSPALAGLFGTVRWLHALL